VVLTYAGHGSAGRLGYKVVGWSMFCGLPSPQIIVSSLLSTGKPSWVRAKYYQGLLTVRQRIVCWEGVNQWPRQVNQVKLRSL